MFKSDYFNGNQYIIKSNCVMFSGSKKTRDIGSISEIDLSENHFNCLAYLSSLDCFRYKKFVDTWLTTIKRYG